MRNERNKLKFDEMCIKVTKCTPRRYSTKNLWSDLFDFRVILPLCVLGLTLTLARIIDRDITDPQVQTAAILNLFVPFLVFSVHIVCMMITAKVGWFINVLRGLTDPTPTIHTLLFSIVLAYPFAVLLELFRHQFLEADVDFVRAGWISILLVLCWEAFAVYLITAILLPVKPRFSPFISKARIDRIERSSYPVGTKRESNTLHVCVTGCEPRELSPQNAWRFFLRPETSSLIAMLCTCIVPGFVIAFAEPGEAWLGRSIFHIALGAIYPLSCVWSYIAVGWLLTESRWRIPPDKGPVRIHFIILFVPLAFLLAFTIEIADAYFFGESSVNVHRLLVVGTLIALVSEAVCAYIICYSIPAIYANTSRLENGAGFLAEETLETAGNAKSSLTVTPSVAAEKSISTQTADKILVDKDSDGPHMYLCATGCRPFKLERCELLKSSLSAEIYLPVLFACFCLGLGMALSADPREGIWYWGIFWQLLFGVTGWLTGILIFKAYDKVAQLRNARLKDNTFQYNFYTLAVILPVCFFYAGLGEFARSSFLLDESFQITRFVLMGLANSAVGEILLVYCVKLGIPVLRAKRRYQKEKLEAQRVGDVFSGEEESPPLQEGIKFLHIRDRTIPADNLIMLSAEGNYIRVSEKDNSWLTSGPFHEILSELDFDEGMRVHRSTWVAFSAFRDFKRRDRKFFLILNDGREVSVARAREAEVREKLHLMNGDQSASG